MLRRKEEVATKKVVILEEESCATWRDGSGVDRRVAVTVTRSDNGQRHSSSSSSATHVLILTIPSALRNVTSQAVYISHTAECDTLKYDVNLPTEHSLQTCFNRFLKCLRSWLTVNIRKPLTRIWRTGVTEHVQTYGNCERGNAHFGNCCNNKCTLMYLKFKNQIKNGLSKRKTRQKTGLRRFLFTRLTLLM